MNPSEHKDNISDSSKRDSFARIAPIKAMEARGWIARTRSDDELQRQLCQFYGTDNLDDIRQIKTANRTKGKPTKHALAAQQCWAYRAMQLASGVHAAEFNKKTAKSKLTALRTMAATPEAVRKVPQVMVAMGIRLVIVEPLPKTKVDGAFLLLDHRSPIIALSLRYERIDYFWFTLMHELSHVFNDQPTIDIDIEKTARKDADSENRELRADRAAASMLLQQDKLEAFIHRSGPFFTKKSILAFAEKVHLHPGIIIGQLQRRKAIKQWANREMLAPVRHIAIAATATDGWSAAAAGGTPPALP